MTDILSRMAQVLSEKGLNDDELVYIDRKLRQEYAGSYVYITRKEHGIDNRIMERIKKSNDFISIAKEFRVSTSTVYRLSRKIGKRK